MIEASGKARPTVTVVFHYRSPFCALIVDRILTLGQRYAVDVEWRIVRDVPRPSSLEITLDNPRFLYNRQDCARRFKWAGLPWTPQSWRLGDVKAASALGQWILMNRPDLFAAYTIKINRAYWCHGRNASDPAVVADIAHEAGLPDADLGRASADAARMNEILDETALWCAANGVLGAPFFMVGEERFWGSDRLAALERHLAELGYGPMTYDLGDDILFAAEPIPTLPIKGREARLAVNRIFCVGRNYAAHAREMGGNPDEEPPFYFTKPSNALVLSGGAVPYPPATKNYHYEMELVIVIGKPAFAIAPKQARDVVFGFAAGLDMTRRDLQLTARDKGRPWDLGKAFEHSAVIGEVRLASEGPWPDQGRLSLKVNGGVKQDTDLANMIWSVDDIVADLSKFYHLQPGDVIFTGTPEGVGPVVAGDKLRGEIDNVGGVETIIVDAVA
jgi:fumarylpyruvate hydrolase